ncbi:MAG: 2-aminoethylphosphonate--pyruvate transaminase [Micrococcales bacterium]|nr:2-aminoethylphosphonate--pyruvate transaminase [Micrococcales bacterium]
MTQTASAIAPHTFSVTPELEDLGLIDGCDHTQRVLLTPGPLTTAPEVRAAAGVDWGSWDRDFVALTARVRAGLLEAGGVPTGLACVPMQGSGTFSVEAAVRTFVPANGGLVVGVNGAYGERMARLAQQAGLRVHVVEERWNRPIDPERLARVLRVRRGFTHVGLIHCETSTGLLNPLRTTAEAVHGAGGKLIVDAMSTFGALEVMADHPAIDAVVAASGKCLEGLPGVGFVLSHPEVLTEAQGRCDSLSLDLVDQYEYMELSGQWRYTPPTHVVAALAVALDHHRQEGGRAARLARYQANSTALTEAAAQLNLLPYLPQSVQAPIIHTYYAPRGNGWSFSRFYDLVRRRGFILYPGKLTEEETFRVGCIGRVTAHTMRQAAQAIGQALASMGLAATNEMN